MTAVKERPILFSGPMVRALLDGSKTQTRRVARPKRSIEPMTDECPYGVVGDRLWVRESFWDHDKGSPAAERSATRDERIEYRATEWDRVDPSDAGLWTPSIHMPRWASRITLTITDVRVERLQEISAEDCIAEGLSTTLREHDAACELREKYQSLWDSLNATRTPWSSNPWVWVVSFTTERAS